MQHVPQRPRELHARRQLHPRRGARAAPATSSPPASTRPASRARAAPAARSPSGSWAASRRWTSGTSTSAASLPSTRNPTLAARADRRDRSGLHYAMRWPQPRARDGRGRCAARRSTTGWPRAARCFGAKMGWERANWFAPRGRRAAARSTRFGRQNWFAVRRAPSTARAREAVAVFDQTSFAKFLLQGADAEAVLQRLCANDIAVPPGRIGLHRHAERARRLRERPHGHAAGRGRLPDRHRLGAARRATSTGSAATCPRTRASRVTDVTGAWAVLGVMGPRSRELLARVSGADLGSAAFPFGDLARDRDRPRPPCGPRASPTWASSAGSSTCRSEYAAAVYDALHEAGGGPRAARRRLLRDRLAAHARRRTARGAASSRPTTRRRRRGWASR